MYGYEDPTATGALQRAGALERYRSLLQGQFRHFGRMPRSGLTIPEAFEEAPDSSDINLTTVKWLAFPRSAQASDADIDADRFALQDEYVEWRTERGDGGRVTRVTFTTEFSDYYEALALQSADAVLAEVRSVTGSDDVTHRDLYGPAFDPAAATPSARAARLLKRARENDWNNGRKSILFLTHRSSTLGALLHLAAACGVPAANVAPKDMCARVGGACVPSRNSDPAVCSALQQLAASGNSFTLVDPVGVVIDRLGGIWKRGGKQIDINASGLWTVNRNGRRATLEVPRDLTVVDAPIETGAAVAARLTVRADVMFAPDAGLPEWSRVGQESSRVLAD